jgi:hypothetical protein
LQSRAEGVYQSLHDAVFACEKEHAKDSLIEVLALAEGLSPRVVLVVGAAAAKTAVVMKNYCLVVSPNSSMIAAAPEWQPPEHIHELWETLYVIDRQRLRRLIDEQLTSTCLSM